MAYIFPEREDVLRMGKRELERQLAAAQVPDAKKEADRLWREALKLVEFNETGTHTYVTKSNLPIVQHWATTHNAQEMVAEWSTQGGLIPQFWPVGELPLSLDPPGPTHEKSDTVWVVRNFTCALDDALLIQRLVSTEDTKDYEEIRGNLSGRGYPALS